MDIEPSTAEGLSNFETPNHMLIKASLKNHSPEQIYDYIFERVGELGMKIKKRQVIIGFSNPELYRKLMQRYEVSLIQGKRIRFSYILNGDENNLQSEQQQRECQKQDIKGHQNLCDDFEVFNQVQYKINKCRVSFLKKFEELVRGTLDVVRNRTQGFENELIQQRIRNREMVSLQVLIEKKLYQMQVKYSEQMMRLNKVIGQFSSREIEGVEGRKQEKDRFGFGKMGKLDVGVYRKYMNQQNYPCKRLCGLNDDQFVVTMKHGRYRDGLLKIYGVDDMNERSSIKIDDGAYGICRLNNYLMIGSCDSSIKYVDLEDCQRIVETSKKISEQMNSAIFDIKVSKCCDDKSEIITLSTDYRLRKFEVSFDEVCSGVYSANFDKNWELEVSQNCYSLQVVGPQVVLFGSGKSVKKYHIEKRMVRNIEVTSAPTKIIKYNKNLYGCSCSNRVELFDLRTDCVVQTFNNITRQVRCLQVLGDHWMMYGGKGEIGLLDDRKNQEILWKSQKHHKEIVYDILRLKDKVVSVDSKGEIYSWAIGEGSGSGIGDGTRMEIEEI